MEYKVYEHIFPNGKRYVGITCQPLNRRWRDGNGYTANVIMTRAIKKYGWENIRHNVLAENLTEEEAFDLEKLLIAAGNLTDRNHGYNLAIGGDHPSLSEESRRKIGEKNRNNRHTEEFKRYISERNSGAGNFMYGKHHTPETKAKISASKKGGPGVNKGKFGAANPHARPVVSLDPETGGVIKRFGSIIDAANYYGILRSGISATLKGLQHVSGGYGWAYEEQKLDPGILSADM